MESTSETAISSNVAYSPSSVVTRLSNRYTTQMSANTQHHKPLGPLHPLIVTLRIPKLLPILCPRLVDLIRSAVTDEDGFSAPLHDDVFTFWDVPELYFDLGEREDVGGRGHGAQELGHGGFGGGCSEET